MAANACMTKPQHIYCSFMGDPYVFWQSSQREQPDAPSLWHNESDESVVANQQGTQSKQVSMQSSIP